MIDIIVLSNEYKSSEYCLNEAGAICFKDDSSEKIVITLPEIIGNYEAGFIDEDYIQYRLLDPNFLDALTIRLQQDLFKHGLLQPNINKGISSINKISNELEKYIASLPIFENLLIPYIDEYGFKRELEGIILAKKSVQDMYCRNRSLPCAQGQLFYKEYNREITIFAADKPGEIRVKTSTVYTIINLSNDNYIEAFSSQFLKKDGGYDSYQKLIFRINRKAIDTNQDKNESEQAVNSPYIVHQGSRITISAHSSAYIEFVTVYDIRLENFFQSKTLGLPCGNYSIQANFDPSFLRTFGENYIFRSQVIPYIGTRENVVESFDKRSIHYSFNAGFPMGGGYVLAISKI